MCAIVGLKPSGGVFGAELSWVPADAPSELGQVMWRLNKGDASAVCLFEPVGEGFVWVETTRGAARVVREQRICEHPDDIGPAIEEFKTRYVNDDWIETH